MIVPFSAADFLDRALAVYRDRTGVIDEPDQPAASLGALTYAELGERSRAMAARHDALGLEVGDRVAFVSHNSARLLSAFFGVCSYGRVLVPVNFRLSADEISYIVEHSGARVLYVDPELAESLADVKADFKFVLGEDDDLYLPGSSRGPGSTTRTPPRRSTTPPGRPPDPRASRSPTATSGPTRSPSRCTPGSPTATCTCTRCRSSTPTGGGCRSR